MNAIVDLEPGASGVGAGFDAFFREHHATVARAMALITGDPGSGQDVAQEAFARTYQRWNQMTSEGHARNFVYKVATNLARSHRRKHFRVVPFGLRRSADPPTPSTTSRAEDWLAIAGALAALSPNQRTCVVMVDYADMDPADAARALGMAASTLRVHLARGRKALREALTLESKDDR